MEVWEGKGQITSTKKQESEFSINEIEEKDKIARKLAP